MKPLSRAVLVGGPVLLLVGVLLMMAEDFWTLSHLVFLVGTLVMLPAALILHENARGPLWLRRVGLTLTVLGALALAGQFLIDFVVRRLSGGNKAIASDQFDTIQDSPVFALTFYQAGPALMFTGLAVFGGAWVGRVGWSGWLLVAGTLVVGAARVIQVRECEVAGLAIIVVAMVLATASRLPRRSGQHPAGIRANVGV